MQEVSEDLLSQSLSVLFKLIALGDSWRIQVDIFNSLQVFFYLLGFNECLVVFLINFDADI